MDEKKDPRAVPAPIDLEQRKQAIRDLVARARESKPDLQDVLPDTAAILREAQPDRAQEKLREASLTPLPMGAAERASPWARDAADAGGIEKAALPSAAMPRRGEAVRDPDDETTLVKGPALDAPHPRRRFAALKGVGAAIAVFAPLTLMYVLLVRPNETGHGSVGAAPTVASASTAPSAPAAPSSTAPPPASAQPAVPPSAEPSTQPSAGPATSASVQPAPRGARPKPRGTVDDPYDGAAVPSPTPSAAPSVTPTVSPSTAPGAPSSTPPAAPSSTQPPSIPPFVE